MPMLQAQQWKVSPESTISFEVDNLKINTVSGSLEMPLSTFDLDVNAVEDAQFEVKVKAESIRTGIKKRDEHMLEEDFFHVERHPYISFSSESIANAEGSSTYLLKGRLKIKTHEKPIEFPFSVNRMGSSLSLNGEFAIMRKEFGLGMDHGSFIIGEEVKVKLNIVLEKN